MATDNQVLITAAQTDLLQSNPQALQRRIIEAVENGYGIRLVEPSNPVVQQMEVAVNLAIGTLEGYAATEQRIYPANAQSYEDLYRHMSDEDYLKTFSSPASSTLDIYLRKDELFTHGAVIGPNGEKRLVIARDTVFKADAYDLVIHNQINIDISQNKGLRITYDMTNVSPLRPLSSNEVQWDSVKDSQYEYIRIRIPVEQLTHYTSMQAVSASTGFNQQFTFEDQYYYTVVYHWTNGAWHRLKTTMTEQVYNINEPTAVLKVFENAVQVVIPTVYFTTNQIGADIRVDVFSSKGVLNVAIQEYEPSLFSGQFTDYSVSNDPSITAFNNLPTKIIMAVKPLQGGENRLAFEDLRDLVVMNATGPQNIPITPAQLMRMGRANGYDIVRNVDNITNRQYLATREIPQDTSTVDGRSPLPVTMSTLMMTYEELITNNDVNEGHTGDRLTIKPTALFKMVNGQLILLPNNEKNAVTGMVSDQLSILLNNNEYLYTPFYYVLDTGENRFRSRAYDLDSPSIPLKNFNMTNPTTGVEVSAVHFSIERVPAGYRLLLLTESNQLFKDIIEDDHTRFNCQLSFRPIDGGTKGFMNAGVLLDESDEVVVDPNGEFFIEFIIETNFDVDDRDGLLVRSFGPNGDTQIIAPAGLTQLMDLVYIVDDVQQPGQIMTDIDTLVNSDFLSDTAVVHAGITHEQISIEFGKRLQRLWTRDKTSLAAETYVKHENDVYRTYESNVFKYDSSGHIEVVYDGDSDTFIQTILHYEGDPELEDAFTSEDIEAASENDVTLSFTEPTFVQGNVGDHFILVGGRDTGNERLYGEIVSVEDGSNITISTPVTQAVSAGATFIFGKPVVKFAAGSNVKDPSGNPIPLTTDRMLLREMDILMFDAKYYFATSQTTVAYRDNIRQTLVRWVTEDIDALHQQLLENTEIFFYPKRMMGNIEVYTVDDRLTTLEATQSLVVRTYVNRDIIENTGLMTSIEETIAAAINTEIRKQTIDKATLTENVLAAVGRNVHSIRIDGLFNDREYIVTVKNAASRFSIGKQAVVLSDGNIAVKDAITFLRNTHSPS